MPRREGLAGAGRTATLRLMGSVITVIVTAFVTGALARFAVPGPDPMPAWLTILIGLVGTLIGAGIVLVTVGDKPAWVGTVGFFVAIALVIGYRRFVQKRPLWGPEAYRFPKRGVGVDQYRERLSKAGIDPDAIGSPFAAQQLAAQQRAAQQQAASAPAAAKPFQGDDPTENPAHYLQLLEELHDSGVLSDDEYTASRTRLLERLRA
jgi:uncharacterized membrane protein YeaQ/YmgE (transglycosylase-associated protein family)